MDRSTVLGAMVCIAACGCTDGNPVEVGAARQAITTERAASLVVSLQDARERSLRAMQEHISLGSLPRAFTALQREVPSADPVRLAQFLAEVESEVAHLRREPRLVLDPDLTVVEINVQMVRNSLERQGDGSR